MTPTTTIAPPTITSTRPGSSPGLSTPLGDRLGREHPEHLLGGGPREAETVDPIAAARDPRRARSRRASTPCRRCRRASSPGGGARHQTVDVGEMIADDRDGLAQLLGFGRIAVQELLGETHAADVDRAQPFGLVAARDELRGAAADVHHEVRPRFGETGGGAEVFEPGLVLAGEQLRTDAEHLLRRPEEIVAVLRVARCARRGRPHLLDRQLVDGAAVPARARRRCARSRPGCNVRSRSTPCPSRVIWVRRSTGRSSASRPVPSTSATSRRVRVRADVDAGDPRHRRCSCTQRPTGSSPPARKWA